MKRLASISPLCVSLAVLLTFAAPATAELIHHWDFEGSFEDSIEGLIGTPLGGAVLTDDAIEGDEALEVGGNGDHVVVPDADSMKFSATDSYSMAIWAKATAETSGWRGVVTKGRDNTPWWGIWIDPSNRWDFGTPDNNLLGTPVAFGSWTHVTIVQDGAAGTREIYTDGVLRGTEIARDAVNFGDLTMGGALSVDEWFVGQIDDVRIYDHALSAAEVENLASGGATLPLRAITADIDATECPPSGRGPITVTISQPVPDGADPTETVIVTETLTGPVSAATVTPSQGGMTTEVVTEDADPLGPFGDHRSVVTNPDCPGGNGDTVDDGDGLFTQTSTGEDIWQNGDTFEFAYSVLEGDFDVSVHVVERMPAPGARWGKHGLMARQDLSSRSRYSFTHDAVGDVESATGAPQNNDDSTRHAHRPTHGGNDNFESTPFPSNPSGDGVDDYCDGVGPDDGTCEVVHHDYLRLMRTGSVFTSFSRADPADGWTLLGQHDWGAGASHEVLVGLATASHSTDCASQISVSYDEVDYGGATVVPVESHVVAVEIVWSVTREQLAAGIEYTVDIAQGALSMSGLADGNPIQGASPVSLLCDSRITALTCTKNPAGGVDLSWENHVFADPATDIRIAVNDNEAGTVPGDSTSTTLAADALENGFNQICLTNSSGLPACCGYFMGTPALIHHWEFEGGFEDSVGDADGTPFGNAMLTDEAKVGDQALRVGGAGDHVEAPDAESLRFAITDSYTLAAWVRAGFVFGSSWRGIVTKGRDFPPWYGIWTSPTDRWTFGASGNSLEGSTVVLDEWVHVAVVQNGPLGTRELWVGGLLDATEIARDASNIGDVWIGGAASVEEWFTGEIDDVRVYGSALDQTHIEALASGEVVDEPMFRRGDPDDSGSANITDAIGILNFLFAGADEPPCMEAADVNDDGAINITDGVGLLNFLFGGTAPPAPPGHLECGVDPPESGTFRGCISYTSC